MNDATTTFDELMTKVLAFQDERGWRRQSTPRNLAISISLEAAELLEHFQWNEEYRNAESKQEAIHELADIMIYCLSFAKTQNIDVSQAITEKLALAAKKYPIEIFNPEKEWNDSYYDTKKRHRAEK